MYKTIELKAFGRAALVRTYPHRETKEIVWKVVADTGEQLHLSHAYVEKLMGVAR